MKKLLVMAFAGMILSVGASAQTKAAQTVKLSTPTVQ
jgi:hypothetical protein